MHCVFTDKYQFLLTSTGAMNSLQSHWSSCEAPFIHLTMRLPSAISSAKKIIPISSQCPSEMKAQIALPSYVRHHTPGSLTCTVSTYPHATLGIDLHWVCIASHFYSISFKIEKLEPLLVHEKKEMGGNNMSFSSFLYSYLVD